MSNTEEKRKARHERVRRKVIGTKERPRLSVYRSLRHIHVQLVDDTLQQTLFSYSTLNKSMQGKAKPKGVALATELGKQFAQEAKSKGFSQVVFDRGEYLYHGNIKAFAEACRKEGLLF